jgi:hypothetical protein
LNAAIDPITRDAPTGMLASTSRLNSAMVSSSACSNRIRPAAVAIAVNTASANSEIGMPPHKLVRNSEE